jgi:hypothetical protein
MRSFHLLRNARFVEGSSFNTTVYLDCPSNSTAAPRLAKNVDGKSWTLTHPAVCAWQESAFGSSFAAGDPDRCKLTTTSGKEVDLNLLFDAVSSAAVGDGGRESAFVNLCRPYEPEIAVDPCHGAGTES